MTTAHNATTRPLTLQPQQPEQHPIRCLSATMLRLLDELAFLARKHQETSPRGGKWCQPSRRYLAEKCGRTVWTISRATNDPRFTRLVRHHQQRKLRGHWRTCKYWIQHRAAWTWSSALHAALALGSRSPKPQPARKCTPIAIASSPIQPRAPSRTHTSPEGERVSLDGDRKAALAAVLKSLQAKLERTGDS